MTECERLIANGTFTRDFFKPEVRCDFLVTEERKKIWAIELDLLLQLDKVCKDHKLTYFLVEGSLLGATRHTGIIPWDDDIDVGMFRRDYEILRNLSNEFNQPYFLQFPSTDIGYGFSFAKLRNSNTTGASKAFAFAPFNQGVCIDIFPFDPVNIDAGKDAYEHIKSLNIDNSTCMRMANPYQSEQDNLRIKACSRRNIGKNLHEIETCAQQFSNQECDGIGMLTNTIYPYERHMFRKEWFLSFMKADFEGFQVSIPCGHNEILKTVYGNYMQLPDVASRGTWHSSALLDPDVPYTVALKTYRDKCYDQHSVIC